MAKGTKYFVTSMCNFHFPSYCIYKNSHAYRKGLVRWFSTYGLLSLLCNLIYVAKEEKLHGRNGLC
jgi:hypothetical protein